MKTSNILKYAYIEKLMLNQMGFFFAFPEWNGEIFLKENSITVTWLSNIHDQL